MNTYAEASSSSVSTAHSPNDICVALSGTSRTAERTEDGATLAACDEMTRIKNTSVKLSLGTRSAGVRHCRQFMYRLGPRTSDAQTDSSRRVAICLAPSNWKLTFARQMSYKIASTLFLRSTICSPSQSTAGPGITVGTKAIPADRAPL